MQIPYQQTQGSPPQTAGLNQTSPGVVGGNAIVQGFSNVASGLLVYAHYQQQQEQADQISLAGNTLNDVGQKLTLKANELRKQQSEQPGNPRVLAEQYTAYSQQLVNETLADPALQATPFVHKYVATHLPTLGRSATKDFQTEQDGIWKQWDQAQSSIVMEDFKRMATTNPALRDEATRQAQAHLMGRTAIGSISGEQFTSQWKAWREETNYSQDMLYAKSHAQSWVDATMRGAYPDGFNATSRSKDRLKEMDTKAHEIFSLGTSLAKDQDTQNRQELTDGYEQQKNRWLSRHLPHQDESGKMRKAESVEKVLAELGTNQSKALLGTNWDTVHTFYQSLDQHLKSAGGVKPRPADYNSVLEGIYRGTYKDSMDVLKAASARNFDIPSTNVVLGKFETERGLLDKDTQERVRQSIDIIKGRFALPGGAALDPADSQGRMNTVLTRHFLWLEGLRGQGGRALQEADLIGQAQKMSDQERRNMVDQIITIVPQIEASLIYKTPNEVAAALKAKEITERQANSYLQEIAQFQALQSLGVGKTPSLGQGRSEAFK